jgi:hypothetical protein
MVIKSRKFKDRDFGESWFVNVEDHWVYDDFKKHKDWCRDWISMDCALYSAIDDRIYLGITSFDENSIFIAYDRRENRFIDLGYSRISKPFDAKFHRALVKNNNDGNIYAAIALLHCSDKQWEAPGSPIIRYDPKTGDIYRLKEPMPHVYIQAAALDQKRNFLYCQCFPPEYLIRIDLETGDVKNLGLVGSGYCGGAQAQNIALDEDGNLWGAWMLTRAWQNESGVDSHRIFKVPAGGDKIEFLDQGLPRRDRMHGFEKPEAFFDLGDGNMYASGGNGSIYRINRESGAAEYLFTPVCDRRSRLTSLALGEDGYAYGVTGCDGKCEVLKLDFRRNRFKLIGDVKDKEGTSCWQIHDIVITGDGTLYACENDNPYRSGYLWEIKL